MGCDSPSAHVPAVSIVLVKIFGELAQNDKIGGYGGYGFHSRSVSGYYGMRCGDFRRDNRGADAIESNRQEKMRLGQVAEVLGFSLGEADAFFREHNIPLNYDLDDLSADRLAIESFLTR
jgi:predicted HTH domain antitoxin